ncbi:mastermind-like domain-containing protein 1 isoform X2 [Pleurodeles waltl]|uniref:mastermind-like domain-containing protein 1 isoform X2 n=1 Tax=Pleurodeles waltl TaxID=8319 RepID=UPI003709BF21
MLLVSQRVDAPRMEAHISLQGSIKRKIDDDSSPVSGGIPDILLPSNNKRLCLDDVTLSMGQPHGASPSMSCSEMQHSPFSSNHSTPSVGVTSHSVLLENNHMNGSSIGSPFSVVPNAGMGTKGAVDEHNTMSPYDDKGNNLQSMDQDLQDLLEELTKMPDPSPNELDLDKILDSKPSDPLCMSHPQANISTTSKPSPQTSHLENHLTSKDFSPGCNQLGAGSPQMGTSSAGTNYSVQPSSKTVPPPIQSKNQLPVNMPNMPGSNWHAQQLKQLAASKQISSTKQQQVQGPAWPSMSPPGLSPPYRAGSSPHHQPFSPQNVIVSGISSGSLQGSNIQSPQNTLLSSITSSNNSSSGPSPPYGSEKLSSPALNQQPFSPQNPLLTNMAPASIPANSIKSPQGNLVSNITSTSTGPSPPYQPEKLSSPAVHQQPFSPQNTLLSNITPTSNPSSMQSSLYKSMTTNQSKSMNMIMHQSSNGLQTSLVSDNTVTQDQFSFNNTKPLSHFAPESAQKMNMTANSRQQSLIHYLQQQQQQQLAPVTQQSQQASNTQFLQQQLRQLMQPQGMQRHLQPTGLPSQRMQFEAQTIRGNVWDLEVQEKPASFCGDDEEQNPGLVPRLHEPGSIPTAGSVSAPPTANGFMRNAILKEQIMRRQLLQVKQRPGMMGVSSEQRNAFVAQQMNPFQNVQQPMPGDCIQPIPNAPPNHRMMTSTQGMLQNSMGSGISPNTVNQSSGSMVMVPHNPGKQQGMYPANSDFSIPLRQSQNSLSMSSGCQTVHSQSAARPGMTLSGFTSSSLGNHSAAQHQSRQSSMARIPSIYTNSSSQMWTSPGISRMPNQNQMDPSMQQFSSNPLFSKQNVRPNITGQQFSHQAVVPPNQIAPGVPIRQMPKLNTGQPSQGMGTLNSQNLRNNMARGQVAGINVMKPVPQSVPSYSQINPAQLGPPNYSTSTGQSSLTFDRMGNAAELPQYSFVPQQSNSALSGHCTEADFIDCLMKSTSNNDEDWLNNLTMLDDILGQHTQNSGHV